MSILRTPDEPRRRRPRGRAVPRRAKRTPAEMAALLLKELAIVVVGAMVISFGVRTFISQPFSIPSQSMQNMLQVGDKIMVSKMGDKIQRGDVVVFEDPARWLTKAPEPRSPVVKGLEFVGLLPDASENHLVKRVIGLPGDTVQCCDAQGRIVVNGQPLDEGDYIFPGATPSDFPFKVVVPVDRVFVLGDHRNMSEDSRCHLRSKGIDAFVPMNKIVGPVSVVALPVEHFKLNKRPATFARIPVGVAPPAEPLIEADRVTC